MFELLGLSYFLSAFVESTVGMTYGFIISMIICSLGFLASQILFALATYNDAKAKCNSESIMWALLVGFLGLIPGIIYLCIRNSHWNRIIICRNCGMGHRISDFNCPQCGAQNPFSQQFINPIAAQQQRSAKNFLIAAIVISIISFILMAIGITGFVLSIISRSEGFTY